MTSGGWLKCELNNKVQQIELGIVCVVIALSLTNSTRIQGNIE